MKLNAVLFATYLVSAVVLSFAHSKAIEKGYSDKDRLDMLSLIVSINEGGAEAPPK